MCTVTSTQLESFNASCLPAAFNDTATRAICTNRRNSTDVPCVVAACTTFLSFNMTFPSPLRLFQAVPLKVHMTNTNTSDLGSVRLVHVLRQFMIENRPDANGYPVSRPLNIVGQRDFSTDDVGVLDFNTSAGNLMREFITYYWNLRAAIIADMGPPGMNTFLQAAYVNNSFFFTPSRCPSADVANIPWLQGNNVPTGLVSSAAFSMMILNLTTDVANWATKCKAIIPNLPTFCAAFESGYYRLESLTNYSIVPSPYRDLAAALRVVNEEWTDCDGPARGCVGYTGPAPA